jgi:uncharacterized membrane protein YozB (DUF420 family)
VAASLPDRGFLPTRGNFLEDLVVTSLVLIVPLLLLSWRWAHAGRWARHRNLMVILTVVLTVVVVLFEADVRSRGGFEGVAAGSRYHGTAFMDWSYRVHMVCVTVTSALWLVLLPVSLWVYRRGLRRNAFGPYHRLAGRVGMVGAALSGLTGLELYVIGLVL